MGRSADECLQPGGWQRRRRRAVGRISFATFVGRTRLRAKQLAELTLLALRDSEMKLSHVTKIKILRTIHFPDI
jgi:hypothetical protein